jgi:hypothetical protein
MGFNSLWQKALVAAGAMILALPLMADVDFQVRRMARQDVPVGMGQCDIRLIIDNEAEVSLQSDRVYIRTIQGREGRDAGSECNMPMPRGFIEGFRFQKMDGRGDMALLSQPSSRGGSVVVARIRDNDGGESRYHFRVTWTDRGYSTSNDPYYNDRYGRYGQPPYGRGRGYGRGGRWGNTQGLRNDVNEAISLCSAAAQNRIARDYRYPDVQVLNVRPDNNGTYDEWIVGDAVARRGFYNQDFTFACRFNYNNGTVQNLDIRRR